VSAAWRCRDASEYDSAVQIVRKSSFTAAPWKNGGGTTHEAIRVPASGEPFRWRVSVAHIEVAGPFSDFAGYDRKMVLLRGAGVKLDFANGEQRVLRHVGEIAEFDGGLSARCELLGGPCVDLNLMVAKSMGAVPVRVQRVNSALPLAASCHESTLVFCIEGRVVLDGDAGEPATLENWDLAVLSHTPRLESRLTPLDSSGALVFLATLSR
jgi:uncharacterized protein